MKSLLMLVAGLCCRVRCQAVLKEQEYSEDLHICPAWVHCQAVLKGQEYFLRICHVWVYCRAVLIREWSIIRQICFLLCLYARQEQKKK